MWLVIECGGAICSLLTYVIVLTVQVGFMRIGIWEEALQGDTMALIHFVIFQYHCALIFWSHFKCMTTEPGILPMQEELDYTKMARPLQ